MCNINVVIFVLSSSYRNSFVQATIEGIREIIPSIQNTQVTYCIIPVNITHKTLEFVIANMMDIVSRDMVVGHTSIASVGELDARVVTKSKPR